MNTPEGRAPDAQNPPAATARPASLHTIEVVHARPEDADTLTNVIVEAARNLAVCQWLIPDPGARGALLPNLVRVLIQDGFERGWVYMTADRSAAALWHPRSAARGERAALDPRIETAAGDLAPRLHLYTQREARCHPPGAHHHLRVLAVHPHQRHQGIGSALLRAHHEHLDHERTAAYLEVPDRRWRDFYRQHGYTDARGAIVLHPGAHHLPMTVLFPLRRPPATNGTHAP